MRSIPSSFQLGGRRWSVTSVAGLKDDDDGTLLYGQTESGPATIRLSTDQSEECAQHTFYHELAHAIFYALGRTALNKDEGLVDAIGNMLLQFEQTRVDT